MDAAASNETRNKYRTLSEIWRGDGTWQAVRRPSAVHYSSFSIVLRYGNSIIRPLRRVCESLIFMRRL